jgi:small subunit ribosomal protein S3Ae
MAKKTVTSWKSKKVYPVLAPENFDYREIGDTVSAAPEKLAGRTIYVSLGELLNDRSKNYLNMVFEVHGVKDGKAHTKFKKFFIPTGYLRSKVRKRTRKIDYLKDITVGGARMRVKIMVLSHHKISVVQRNDIKARMTQILRQARD